MADSGTDTYFRSLALGRGNEVSDNEFYSVAEGLTAHIEPSRLGILNTIVGQDPWRRELDQYRIDLEQTILEDGAEDTQQYVVGFLEQRFRPHVASGTESGFSAQVGQTGVSKVGEASIPGDGAQTRSTSGLMSIIQRLQRILEDATSPGVLSALHATRGDTPVAQIDFEEELTTIEETLGLSSKGLSLMRIRLACRQLAAENRSQRVELQELRQLIADVEATVRESTGRQEP